MKKKLQIQVQQYKNLNKQIEKHVNNFAVHHIHVKCGDEFFTVMHRGGFVEASELMDQLVKYITKGFEE